MRLALLAITPPRGEVDPAIVQAWDVDGAAPDLAVLVRREGHGPVGALADPDLTGMLERARDCGVPIVASCDPGDLEGIAAARHAGCVGVQLRGDPSANAVRAARQAGAALVGASMHLPAPAALPGADWLCVAPVFAPRTATPGRAKVAAGLGVIEAYAGRGVHVIALGGVTAQTAAACVAAGATGLASIRSFFGPRAEVADNVAAFRAALRVGPASP